MSTVVIIILAVVIVLMLIFGTVIFFMMKSNKEENPATVANTNSQVVAENERAVSMYERAGFVECGRNPKGFRSRIAGFQEVISMRLEL